MTIIVGLAGPKKGGKDTIANGLVALLEADKRRFAGKLYGMAAVYDPAFHPEMSHELKEGFVLNDPELGTRRNFLEKLGTEFGRDMISRRIWTKGVLNSAKLPTVICDVRFEDEAQAIRNAGGLIIHLRPDFADYGRKHVSDHPLEVADADVVLKTLKGQVEAAIESAGQAVVQFYSL